ncbi:MAG: DUF211 domain-containing protein [Candidatus Thermoplasmatota archaeon]|nr:DUF211 domain-containing protein [Candidatus Thermoplasmatota archaeon]
MANIKRVVLDVLKPHRPSILEIADRVSNLDGVSGVNISLDETDAKTQSVKITIEGTNINYDKVQEVIGSCGAEVHSLDAVSAGMRIVEEATTPQDR